MAAVPQVRFAVIDVETTGLGRHSRIVDFACVSLVGSTPAGEFATLINPVAARVPSAARVHGLTETALRGAPSFTSALPLIAARLDGAILVAHNLRFETRMLAREVARIGAHFDPGIGICTLRSTGLSLLESALGSRLALPDHTAIGDARTTAALFLAHADKVRWGSLRPCTWRGARRIPLPHRD